MLECVNGIKSSVETFVLSTLKFVIVVVKTLPIVITYVAQIVIVMKPKRLALKEKSYEGMKDVMGNVLIDLIDII